MDTRFLESFVTVVENGSIAEAARRLNLTPAGVGQRLRALEDELGTRLIVRSGRTVTPTEAGLAIVERARIVLREVRDLHTIVTDETLAGELRLGAVPTAITGVLPDSMMLMRNAYPKIDIYIAPGYSLELYSKIIDAELDGAIMSLPYFALPKVCSWKTLREEPLIVLAPASMAGADAHTVLATEPFIRYDESLWGGRLADPYLRQARIRPHERFESAHGCDRGAGHRGWPIACADWAPPWPEGLALAKLPLPGKPPTRRMGLLWTRASVRIRLVQAFLEQATAAVASRHTAH